MEESPPARGVKLIFFIVFVVEMGLALYAHFVYAQDAASYDAVTRTGVGMDLLWGYTQGRQG